MKKMVIMTAALLSACSTAEPGIEIRTQEVVVTRIEKCVATPDIPKRPADLGRRPTTDARVLADILLAKVLAWQNYGDKADAVLKGCAGPTPPAAN